jgi:NAD-dependent DNA ligase
MDDIEKLTKLIEGHAAALYVLGAENRALLSVLAELRSEIFPSPQAGERLRVKFREQKKIELERMILGLGDRRPDVAEELQKLLDRATGEDLPPP